MEKRIKVYFYGPTKDEVFANAGCFLNCFQLDRIVFKTICSLDRIDGDPYFKDYKYRAFMDFIYKDKVQ